MVHRRRGQIVWPSLITVFLVLGLLGLTVLTELEKDMGVVAGGGVANCALHPMAKRWLKCGIHDSKVRVKTRLREVRGTGQFDFK